MTTTRRYEFSFFPFNIFYLENAKVVSSTFQIHSLNELVVSLILALEATELVSQPVAETAVKMININLVSVQLKR